MNQQWVIPDIHGYKKTLQTLIEEQLVPSRSDTLFFLGDLIDRGPDSKGVIDYLMHLEEQGYDIQVLRGNHEDCCLEAWKAAHKKKSFFSFNKTPEQRQWEAVGGLKTLESFGVKLAQQIPEHYIDWIAKTKFYIELDNYILVHAGMNFKIENPFEDTFSMLWIGDFVVDPKKINGKKIIHGHVPVSLEMIEIIRNSPNYHFISLDNCVYHTNKAGYGNLLAFNIETNEIYIQANVDE
ncbi:MAG: metallophosphoesterase [Lentimicrobiaceae bacterium]|jgi:serine/threonine protein phosphatase 1|nr:metallophosphoesterase [Lentimicrobiaceae bacterium]